MVNINVLSAVLFLCVALPNIVAPFFIVRRLTSTSTSYHDNPAISPLNIMDSNPAFLRLTSRNMPDLPESFSSSAKRFSFSGNPYDAVIGRLPYYF
ncbi:hypothetical protein RB195_016978 [Necator americanus]|uniref:Leucine Rich repeat-containing domain protein n=1 Tax=Necator americanus TaxID=51031 RepID=A0ABR1C5I5_NECAM